MNIQEKASLAAQSSLALNHPIATDWLLSWVARYYPGKMPPEASAELLNTVVVAVQVALCQDRGIDPNEILMTEEEAAALGNSKLPPVTWAKVRP